MSSRFARMQRRDLLKMTALIPRAPLIVRVRAAAPTSTGATTRRRVRPTDEAWQARP